MTTLKFTKTHEWIKQEGDVAIIGITDHAQDLLGDMVYVELPKVGDTVHASIEMGVVESVKAASDLYSPASGTVVEINQLVLDNPALVNKDPFGEGWLIKLKMNNPDEMNGLLDEKAYLQEITEGHS